MQHNPLNGPDRDEQSREPQVADLSWQDASAHDARVRVRVEAPGQIEEHVVEIAPGSGALLGRLPDATRAPVSEASTELESYAIAAPRVSANHAAVWLSDDRLYVQDLGSRNGTWVHVSPHTTVQLPRGDAQVRLGAIASCDDGNDLPEPAQFHGSHDYGLGVATAIRQWLEHHGVHAKVGLADRDHSKPAQNVLSTRLANNEILIVQSEGTIDERLYGRFSRVTRYVVSQNALYVAEDESRREGMILASAGIRQVHSRIVELAKQGLSGVVLLGPSGTGKERLARAFHRNLKRDGALVAINCSALSHDRLVADLFGAEAGAYTGAQKTMIGAVERADGGTLFLDEVGELPLEIQPQLLRFLDLGEYQRLGAMGVPRTADVRIVAATNCDLRRMVIEGRFRADLFYRLALEVVDIPPLRQRFADVTAYLQTQLLGEVSAYDALTADAVELLRNHGWHGNFRELVHLVHRLPNPIAAGSLEAPHLRNILEAGAVEPIRPISPHKDMLGSWADCVRSCLATFADARMPEPSSWADVVGFVEQYLKPYALVHLAGVANATGLDVIAPARVAERVKADRGTVIKQLRRYFEIPKANRTPR